MYRNRKMKRKLTRTKKKRKEINISLETYCIFFNTHTHITKQN